MFNPLHIISGYTFLSSGLTVDKIVSCLKKGNYLGGALTDEGVLYALPEYYTKCEEAGLVPRMGIQLEIDGILCCLYIKDEDGYRGLCRLSKSLDGMVTTLEDVKEYTDKLTLIIDTNTDKFKTLLEDEEALKKTLLSFSRVYKDMYLGVEISKKEEREYVAKIREFATRYPYNLVAFPKIRYEKEDDAIVLKIVNAIKNEETLTEKSEKGMECFHPQSFYEKLYTKEEIDNTEKILKDSTFTYKVKRGKMIKFPTENSKKLIRELSEKGLKEKGIYNDTYKERLDKELDVIDSMGYNDYFLVVSDYVKASREKGILTGPGRGSAGGSLVAYTLDITQIDPIKNDLQFERFLNKSRKSMPDIDIDFMDTRRDEAVAYVKEKYGENKVANIITFQTILARQALRDIGRVYNYKEEHIDRLCKMLTNPHYSLRESYKYIKPFKEEVDRDKYILEIVTLASKIEFLPRQEGLHAAGIIINDQPLEEVIPVKTDFEGNYITQYEMGYLEEDGFLKMDFLGLRNLTIIDSCVKQINEDYNLNLDPYNLPYDQKETYQIICKGETMGIFQLESAGMKRAIKEIEPSSFNDIVALLALFRPGPMDSIPIYSKRKKGLEKVTYSSPEMEKILSPTYGIIVYQEQINQIAIVMAGLSGDEADNFRRAVSKKEKDIIASEEEKFINGAIANGYTQKEGKETFDLIAKFANYGFNKSHAVGYATITLEMAYLKAFYPLEFYSAIMQYGSNISDSKFNEYIQEMRKNGVDILLPSINKSSTSFKIYQGKLVYPLTGIKNMNMAMTYNIVKEREENGEFTDFYQFVTRMHPYKISESQVLKLIDAGAFDQLNPSRASLRSSINYAFQLAKLSYNGESQIDLGLALPKPKIIKDEDDTKENLEKEYEALGIILSDNPLSYRKDVLVANNVTPIADVKEGEKTTIAGILITKKVIQTKGKKQMAFIKIFDESGEMEITVFPDLYDKSFSYLSNYNALIIKGKKEKGDNTFIADEISLIEV
ncbi:MAG: DNA polymerase III subunit alpha [Coprobacillus sp.]|nr:DNA polymerase III subunit alpha [Coprobacillus sp.]